MKHCNKCEELVNEELEICPSCGEHILSDKEDSVSKGKGTNNKKEKNKSKKTYNKSANNENNGFNNNEKIKNLNSKKQKNKKEDLKNTDSNSESKKSNNKNTDIDNSTSTLKETESKEIKQVEKISIISDLNENVITEEKSKEDKIELSEIVKNEDEKDYEIIKDDHADEIKVDMQSANLNSKSKIDSVCNSAEHDNGINLTHALIDEYPSKTNKTKKGKSKLALVGCLCLSAVITGGCYTIYSKINSEPKVIVEDDAIKQTKPPEDTNTYTEEKNNEETNINLIEKYSDRDYIIDNTDKEKITFDSLNKYSYEELCIARNEILARHGYVFSDYPNLQSYFESKSWYSKNTEFSGELSSDLEKDNITHINSMEFLKMAKKYNDDVSTDYIFNDSNTRELTLSEVRELNDWQLLIAKNEIYARYGMEFSTSELHSHFSNKSWYKIDKVKQNSFKLNDIENKNIDTILEVQNDRISKRLKHDL